VDNKRLLPHAPLPRQYPFLSRHAARSFLTYTTYDFGAAAFDRLLTIPHPLGFAPHPDMWMAKLASVTGDAVKDYRPDIEPVTHTPVHFYTVGGFGPLEDSYVCSADKNNVYINVNHASATSGTYHVYFHVKLYADGFEDVLYDGERSEFVI
jgi:hypothetical protein